MAIIFLTSCNRCSPEGIEPYSLARLFQLDCNYRRLICESKSITITPEKFFGSETSRRFENDRTGYYSIGICRDCGFEMMLDLNKYIPQSSVRFYLWTIISEKKWKFCSDCNGLNPRNIIKHPNCKPYHNTVYADMKRKISFMLMDLKKQHSIQYIEQLFRSGDYHNCTEECLKMLRFNKHEIDVYFYFGASQIQNGKYENGYLFLKKAVELFPDKSEYYGYLAETEYLMYKPRFYTAAINICNKGLAINPEDSKCLAMRSIITISYRNYFPEDKTLKYNVIADLEKSAKQTGNLFHWELLSREKLKISDFQGCIEAATFVLDNMQWDFHHKCYLTIDCQFTLARIARAYYEMNNVYPENTNYEMVEKEAEKSNWGKLHIGKYSKKHKIKAGEVYQWDLW